MSEANNGIIDEIIDVINAVEALSKAASSFCPDQILVSRKDLIALLAAKDVLENAIYEQSEVVGAEIVKINVPELSDSGIDDQAEIPFF